MSKFKFFKISKYRKLRLLYSNNSSKLFIVFLHGFMSDIEGEKPKNFYRFCKKNKIDFLAIEYSGHGKSSGNFLNGNISIKPAHPSIALFFALVFLFLVF